MSKISTALISQMAYRDVSCPETSLADCEVAEPPITQGIPEDEVERRIEAARADAAARLRTEFQTSAKHERDAAAATLAEALNRFEQERTAYFERVETEVLRLGFAIARKILEREVQMDPDLIGALVRIALERMRTGPSVRVRVHPENAEHWRSMAKGAGGQAPRWEVAEDPSLSLGDCIVETEMGRANFGFDAQVSGVEEAFAHLLARRPGR